MTRKQVPDYQTEIAGDALAFFARKRRIRWLTKLFPWLVRFLLAGKRVLVVGAGRGKDCTYFVNAGASAVVGLDVVDDLGADFKHPRVSYHRGSAEEMELASDSFDLVYSVATMEHIPNIERAFSEMVRVTCPGGLVYCFAEPLWNSREGHHKFGLFPEEPWIHLRMSRDEMVAYGRSRGLRASPDRDIADDVDFIFSTYFNRVAAERYAEVCSRLPVKRLIKNELWQEPISTLGDREWSELEARGLTKEEVLTLWHKFIAEK